MKITICGSMTASKEMVEVEKKLKTLNHTVILPEFAHDYSLMNTMDEMHSESAKNKVKYDLIRGYFEEIKNSDAVLVVNIERKSINGYIGGNSFLEMGFAHILNKKIFLLNPIPEMGYTDEIKAMEPVVLNNDLSLIQ